MASKWDAVQQPIITVALLMLLMATINAQVVSYGMRKLALSMNQFGLDMLRTMDRMDRVLNSTNSGSSSFAFCPFCVGSSLAMMLAGLKTSSGTSDHPNFTTKPSTFDSLRHALYLGQMQPQEIHLAFFDLAAHLQLNLPEGFKAKRSVDKSISSEIDSISEEIEDSLEDVEDLDEDEALPSYPKFLKLRKRSPARPRPQEDLNQDTSADEEEASEYRASEGSVSSEYAQAEPNEFTEYRRNSLLPPDILGSSTLMHFLSQIYIQRYLPLDYNYYVLLQYYYKTPIRSLDFAYAPEESRQHINAMVATSSHERIQNILHDQKRETWSRTRFLLLSGLYFEGRVDFRDTGMGNRVGKGPQGSRNRVQQNSKRPTQALAVIVRNTTMTMKVNPPPPAPSPQPPRQFNPFKPLEATTSSKTKEGLRLRYSFSSYLNATILEMPFTGGSFLSLVALVPISPGPRSFATILSRLNAQLIVDLVQHLEIRRIDVTMPQLNLSHSITNWNILFTQMGLASLFDASDPDESPLESFAGMEHFPLAEVTQLQHKTVLDIGIEETIADEPPKKSGAAGTRIVRLKNRRSTEIVHSQVMKVLERPGELVEPLLQSQSKQVPVGHQVPSSSPSKRPHVNLEEEFLFFILDNISGLVVTMGKHRQETGV